MARRLTIGKPLLAIGLAGLLLSCAQPASHETANWTLDDVYVCVSLDQLDELSPDVARLQLEDMGDEAVPRLARFKHLEQLVFSSDWAYKSKRGLTDAGLARLCSTVSVRRLAIYHGTVSDEGCQVLAGMRSLQRLQLGVGTNVTSKGRQALRERRPDVELEKPDGPEHPPEEETEIPVVDE